MCKVLEMSHVLNYVVLLVNSHSYTIQISCVFERELLYSVLIRLRIAIKSSRDIEHLRYVFDCESIRIFTDRRVQKL